MRINLWECAAAGVVIAFGLSMAYWGSSYQMGTISRMGPGYFPVALGLLTAVLGLATMVQVRTSDAPAPDIPWRTSFFVFAGVITWAVLVERIGFVPSSLALIVLTSLGRPPIHVWIMIITAILVTAASVLLFIYGFGLPLRLVRW